MAAVQLTAHGGTETLCYREDVPVPLPGPGEVLIRVSAAGINNTDINTRIGWYAADSNAGTAEANESGPAAPETATPEKGDWSGMGLSFPRIQGADACGEIVATGHGVGEDRLGERVIVQSCLRSLASGNFTPWLGSERDGAFAQFVCAPAADTYSVRCDLSDAELAAIPCAFATAENLINRAKVAAGEQVLVTGASGNVGIAAVQLARRRGADVTAIAAEAKFPAIRAIGARRCVGRDAALVTALGAASMDVVIDVVGGPQWPALLEVLKIKGRYAVSGAIGGPIVQMDLRPLYLKDLTLYGCTSQDQEVFPNLVSYIERGEIRPLVSRTYALRDIAAAQEEFLSKTQIGKIVLIPPPLRVS
ncbi:MAG: alcohol dehydrogenase family protein [Rhodospirillaceae bacterium]|nr:alcohol dehydrogenase family protein [Rhodospirillaceae bacterium]